VDNDGDEDIVVVMGGAVPGDHQPARLFENPGNGNNWITLRLEGQKTNRAAVGARIRVTVLPGTAAARSVYRTVSSGGSFGASPLEQHIGLGKAPGLVSVEVWWPASGIHQIFPAVKTDQSIDVKELGNNFYPVDRRAFRLGKTRPLEK
jgi:hypothetical protein